MSTNKRSIDPAIIAALIGVMGTICVTAITLYMNRTTPVPAPLPTSTASPTISITNTPVPTDTVPAGEPTSTAAPPAIGADWANGCISALWKPYPATIQTTERNGCLVEPVNLFFAADGRLTFLVTGKFDGNQVYGMFAPLPATGNVSLQAFLRNLQQGEIWMGIFAAPDFASQGTIIVIPPGDVKKRPLIQKTMPGQAEVQRTQAASRNPPLYDVSFAFGNNSVTTTLLGNRVFNAVPVVSAQQWLFIGYRVVKGTDRIDAEFLNLLVQGQ